MMKSVQQQIELIRGQIHEEGCEYIPIDDALGGGVFFYPEVIDSEAAAHSDNPIIRAIFKTVGFTFHERIKRTFLYSSLAAGKNMVLFFSGDSPPKRNLLTAE
mgnify:CR=1 FL=1